MIFPDVTLKEWERKYDGLTPRSTSCRHCGEPIKTITPYITKDYVGLIAFECPSCKKPHRTHVSRPISKKVEPNKGE